MIKSSPFLLQSSTKSGFTLVEISIVLAIIGVLFTGGVMTLRSVMDDVRYKVTQQRLEGIANAIGIFTQQYYYIPTPSSPINFTGVSSPSATNTGLVPYATLGLKREQVQDGYGNWITYGTTGALTSNNVVHRFASVRAFEACRMTNVWVVTGTQLAIPLTYSYNRNPRKARFCCRQTSGAVADIRILDHAGGAALTSTRSNPPSPLDFLLPDADAGVDTDALSQGPAFVLVSHGRNGYGAYLADGTTNRVVGPAIASRLDERENEDNDDDYVSTALSRNDGVGNQYFDDILLWKTPNQILSQGGKDSCARP